MQSPQALLAGFFFWRFAILFRLAKKELGMTYRLYGDLGSGAFSAEAALAEVGAPYEFELISLDKNEQKAPQFLSLNPSGKIPALRLPAGEIVTESLAILLTLADHFPQSGLLPAQAGPARANAYRWLAFMASEIYPFVEIVDYPERFVAGSGAGAGARTPASDRAHIGWPLSAGRRVFPAGYLCRDVLALERGQGLAAGESAPSHRVGGCRVKAPGDRAGVVATFRSELEVR